MEDLVNHFQSNWRLDQDRDALLPKGRNNVHLRVQACILSSNLWQLCLLCREARMNGIVSRSAAGKLSLMRLRYRIQFVQMNKGQDPNPIYALRAEG